MATNRLVEKQVVATYAAALLDGVRDAGGAQDVTNFAIDCMNKCSGKGPGGPGGGGPGGPSGAPKKGQAYSKMAGGPPKGSMPASHQTWSPIQPAQDSTPWPEPFETLDNVKTHYVVGLGENKGAVPKKKP